MKFQYFGDSYDIVKKSMIAWLGEFGDWAAHPMYTEPVEPKHAALFSRFLNARLVSTETLTPKTNRTAYFAPYYSAGNLFFDPNTGVRLESRRGVKSVNYVFGQELIVFSRARPASLTLVFDQSYSQGDYKPQVREKLEYLAAHGVNGFAYCSHASFLLFGGNARLVKLARCKLLDTSGLPSWRLLTLHSSG